MDSWCCAPFSLFSLISIDIGELPAEVENNLIMFESGNFMSFTQLQTKYGIQHSHFFGVLQVRHFVKSNLMFHNRPTNEKLE